MDNSAILIIICCLLLISYIFDLTARHTRIPSVILLLGLGFIVKEITIAFKIHVPDLSPALPVLGTVGLILIVLEGTLELEFNKSKLSLIRKSSIGAVFSMIVLAAVLALMFRFFGNYSLKDSLINAIPLCVISSAIAIPSVQHLSRSKKEFIIYESSLSDIVGVLFFNFIALNEVIDTGSFGYFALDMILITVVSIVATIGLSLLLSRIENHIKFVPITLLIILIYYISKLYHLPALVFVLIFGLVIGNIDELKRFRWMDRFKPDSLQPEVTKFKELTTEATFLVRTMFFLLFGYLLETDEILNQETALIAVAIIGAIVAVRSIQLWVSGIKPNPLVFIAPRGLITILLFLSIEPANQIGLVNKSLISQVIILSTLLMMFGMIITGEGGAQAQEPLIKHKNRIQNPSHDLPEIPDEEEPPS